jgi:signal transduction histidine kinase/DNA-binding response OmpR family regulator
MNDVNKLLLEERILVLAPTAADFDLRQSLLADAGMTCLVCADLCSLCLAYEEGASAIVLTEEVLEVSDSQCLMDKLHQQPVWSDVPILLMTSQGADSPVAVMAMERLGNVTLLERPIRINTLVSALRAALRARRWQYELRKLHSESKRRADELQTILDILPIGVAIAHDPQCRRITHNPYMSEILSVPAWANASLTAPEIERPNTFTNYRNGIEVPTSELPMQLASTGVEVRDLELDLVCQGRDPRSMLYHARPLFDEQGQVRGSVGVCLDITDRKRAEAQLRASEQRLAAELEAMSRLHALSSRLMAVVDVRTALDDLLENAILSCEADFGNVQVYNPQIKALEIVVQRGFQRDFLDYFLTVRVDDGSACALAMKSGERIVIEDVQEDPAFEPHRSIAAVADFRGVHSTPLKDRNGSVIGMLSVHFRQPHRSSEREQRLLDLYARHASDLIERNRFEEALKEANHRKDEFLATLAHELRNPLAPILNALQIIRLSPNPQTWADARSMMERQLGQMVRLIDDLLDVSRITRGKVLLQRERVELATIVRNAVEACRPLIESCGHELHVSLPPKPLFLDADSTRLTQVFSNLLNNAAKYSDWGAHINLTAERKGKEVVVGVKDTGIGIAPDMLPKVFEWFTQVHRDQKRSHGGLGIGLTLVKRLVEMHGGAIQASSDGPGKGSHFVVRLPLLVSAVDANSQPVEDSQSSPSPVKSRILVVDDLKDTAESLAMFLRFMGNEVRIAYDGEEAVDAAAEFHPNLALLDIGLPKLDGYEVCRRIRQLPLGSEMVLVAVTGWGQEEDRRKAKEAGFDHHMIKPVACEAVEKLLQSLPVQW